MIRKYFIPLIVFLLCSCKHPDADSMTNSKKRISVDQNMSVVAPAEQASPDLLESTSYTPPSVSVEQEVEEVNAIPMERKDGVTYVWIEVNGIPLKFIFDTGASSIFISPAEATVLVRQGLLDESDILGQQDFEDATGGISTGTIINLKDIKIGSRILRNVKASVSDNIESPLLLGQSALEQFGSIEIDNRNDKLILK